MKRFTCVFCAAILVSLSPQPSMAQQQHGDLLSWAMPMAPDAAMPAAERLLEAGDRHWHRLEFDRAERAYSEAVRVIENQGRLADDALWKVAAMQFAQRDHAAAARSLDRLAAGAERFGRPEIQARALLEAAILHHRAGNNDRSLRSVERLLPLRSSPHLPEQLRREIATRIRR